MPREPGATKNTDGFADAHAPKIITLDGELDLRRADRVRADLLAAIDSGEPLRVELGHATHADVAFVQVLLAAVRAAARRGCPLAIAGLGGGPLPALFAALGLIRSQEDAEQFLTQFATSEAPA